jgi:hypothetical protein
MTGPAPEDRDTDRETARRKLIGRAIIIAFGVLLLAYIAVMWLPRQGGH